MGGVGDGDGMEMEMVGGEKMRVGKRDWRCGKKGFGSSAGKVAEMLDHAIFATGIK
jgi:hypothetical protein